VHRLLHVHFHKTLSINQEARDYLIPKVIDSVTSIGAKGAAELGGRVYSTWNFMESSFKKDLINRGTYDPSQPVDKQSILPRYDFRDFGVPLYDIMHKYVSSMLNVFYNQTITVAADTEIQAWAHEIVTGGKMKGFPDPIQDLDQLIEIVTQIIWTASAQHAAVNFQQFDILAWIPNLPLALFAEKWPTSKDQITQQLVFSMLPNFNTSARQIAAVTTLSALPEHWDTLLYAPHWENQQAQKVVDQFIADLKEYQTFVHEKNKGRKGLDNYVWMNPPQVPSSTFI